MNISKAVLDNVTPQIEELKRKREHAVADLSAMNAEIARLETLQQLSEPVPVQQAHIHPDHLRVQ